MSQTIKVSDAIVPLINRIKKASQERRPVRFLVRVSAAEIKIARVADDDRRAFTRPLVTKRPYGK